MKKFLLFLLFIFICSVPSFAVTQPAQNTSLLLNGSVTEFPEGVLGMWRVVSNIEDTDSPLTFRKNSLDLWNLTRIGNVMKLCNPFSGAEAEVTLISNNDKHVIFEKLKHYEKKRVTDTVELNLNGDYFEGYNKLKLETLSDIDGSVIKVEHAKYKIKGERISGGKI